MTCPMCFFVNQYYQQREEKSDDKKTFSCLDFQLSLVALLVLQNTSWISVDIPYLLV